MSLTKSPYSSPPTKIVLDDESEFWVPSVFIDKYPKLIDECRTAASGDKYKTLSISPLSNHAAHVLVHYLFTGTYQSLETVRFATSVEVYTLAGEYELSGLEDLAKVEMECVAPKMKVTRLIDILKDECPYARTDDVWLHNFIKSRINPLLENPPIPATNPVRILSMTNFLFRAMLELYPEKISAKSSMPSSELESQGSLKLADKKRQAGSHTGDEARKGKKRKETGLQSAEETTLLMSVKDGPVQAEN
ncbi:hypothetical protein F4821DRAFT_243770 [Hypoxylon rubiginosum]|uniref:Uncharacterized protein n=1 Tax=Hypoxylon rubiginosum TaxID=110542 RepID=A0ACC0CU85_9PEZI|nr:hypothetical protein F4821DRAFT_243770 [Hypoxylon rubiginosum]